LVIAPTTPEAYIYLSPNDARILAARIAGASLGVEINRAHLRQVGQEALQAAKMVSGTDKAGNRGPGYRRNQLLLGDIIAGLLNRPVIEIQTAPNSEGTLSIRSYLIEVTNLTYNTASELALEEGAVRAGASLESRALATQLLDRLISFFDQNSARAGVVPDPRTFDIYGIYEQAKQARNALRDDLFQKGRQALQDIAAAEVRGAQAEQSQQALRTIADTLTQAQIGPDEIELYAAKIIPFLYDAAMKLAFDTKAGSRQIRPGATEASRQTAGQLLALIGPFFNNQNNRNNQNNPPALANLPADAPIWNFVDRASTYGDMLRSNSADGAARKADQTAVPATQPSPAGVPLAPGPARKRYADPLRTRGRVVQRAYEEALRHMRTPLQERFNTALTTPPGQDSLVRPDALTSYLPGFYNRIAAELRISSNELSDANLNKIRRALRANLPAAIAIQSRVVRLRSKLPAGALLQIDPSSDTFIKPVLMTAWQSVVKARMEQRRAQAGQRTAAGAVKATVASSLGEAKPLPFVGRITAAQRARLLNLAEELGNLLEGDLNAYERRGGLVRAMTYIHDYVRPTIYRNSPAEAMRSFRNDDKYLIESAFLSALKTEGATPEDFYYAPDSRKPLIDLLPYAASRSNAAEIAAIENMINRLRATLTPPDPERVSPQESVALVQLLTEKGISQNNPSASTILRIVSGGPLIAGAPSSSDMTTALAELLRAGIVTAGNLEQTAELFQLFSARALSPIEEATTASNRRLEYVASNVQHFSRVDNPGGLLPLIVVAEKSDNVSLSYSSIDNLIEKLTADSRQPARQEITAAVSVLSAINDLPQEFAQETLAQWSDNLWRDTLERLASQLGGFEQALSFTSRLIRDTELGIRLRSAEALNSLDEALRAQNPNKITQAGQNETAILQVLSQEIAGRHSRREVVVDGRIRVTVDWTPGSSRDAQSGVYSLDISRIFPQGDPAAFRQAYREPLFANQFAEGEKLLTRALEQASYYDAFDLNTPAELSRDLAAETPAAATSQAVTAKSLGTDPLGALSGRPEEQIAKELAGKYAAAQREGRTMSRDEFVQFFIGLIDAPFQQLRQTLAEADAKDVDAIKAAYRQDRNALLRAAFSGDLATQIRPFVERYQTYGLDLGNAEQTAREIVAGIRLAVLGESALVTNLARMKEQGRDVSPEAIEAYKKLIQAGLAKFLQQHAGEQIDLGISVRTEDEQAAKRALSELERVLRFLVGFYDQKLQASQWAGFGTFVPKRVKGDGAEALAEVKNDFPGHLGVIATNNLIPLDALGEGGLAPFFADTSTLPEELVESVLLTGAAIIAALALLEPVKRDGILSDPALLKAFLSEFFPSIQNAFMADGGIVRPKIDALIEAIRAAEAVAVAA
jgi:hypothetical protein